MVDPEFPPPVELPPVIALGDQAFAALLRCVEAAREERAKYRTSSGPVWRAVRPASSECRELFDFIQKSTAWGEKMLEGSWHYAVVTRCIHEFAKTENVHAIHLIRLSRAIGGGDDWIRHFLYELLGEWVVAKCPRIGLRELSQVFESAGHPPDWLAVQLIDGWDLCPWLDWESERIWPYLWQQSEVLVEALTDSLGWNETRRRERAIMWCQKMPVLPARVDEALWKLALNSKTHGAEARRSLETVEGLPARLGNFLTQGTAMERATAARWLGDFKNGRAADTLLTAAHRERNEAVLIAIFTSLQKLGVPVDSFLNRAGLQTEAAKGLKKAVSGLEWFPFDGLPPVHWQDSGERLSPDILKWWIVQAFKLKSPAPGPLLSLYARLLRRDEREAAGLFIAQAWIGQDTFPVSFAEAQRRASAFAAQMFNARQYLSGAQQSWTYDQFHQQALQGAQEQPAGSAVASKGVLAVAGALCGGSVAAVTAAYLKKWYGQRAAQCRALLQMLAWVDHPMAVQTLLTTGARFRTRSIQEEASRQTALLAERKGWTMDELADRTVPSAGMDDAGNLELDFGPRRFTARLNARLEFELSDDQGSRLKALPDPRQSDDQALAAAAKKLFSSAKKELKELLKLQKERLYEAMAAERSWPAEDWRTYLAGHPVLRHYTQKLVWAAQSENQAAPVLFRPLPDGSLTDIGDSPAELPPGARIAIAHALHVGESIANAWQQHFSDYEVEPLFPQFGQPAYTLPEALRGSFEIRDFEGHMIEAFKLRGRATKRGWQRGETGDGGRFYDYVKRFPGARLTAVIAFSGNNLPENNETVALMNLHFERIEERRPGASSTFTAARVEELDKVPAILLSECWNDWRAIAAEGTGFDPDWEKKTH